MDVHTILEAVLKVFVLLEPHLKADTPSPSDIEKYVYACICVLVCVYFPIGRDRKPFVDNSDLLFSSSFKTSH